MDVSKWEAKQKKCLRTLKHFLFLPLVSEKEKSKSQTGTRPAKGNGFIIEAFF